MSLAAIWARRRVSPETVVTAASSISGWRRAKGEGQGQGVVDVRADVGVEEDAVGHGYSSKGQRVSGQGSGGGSW